MGAVRLDGSEVGPQKRQGAAALQDAARLPMPMRRWDRNSSSFSQFLKRKRESEQKQTELTEQGGEFFATKEQRTQRRGFWTAEARWV